MARTIDGRLAYADLLRVLATIAAVVLSTSIYWLDGAAGSSAYTVLYTYNVLTRWCVPLFVMLSGAFLLDPKKGVKLRDIFLRYTLRIVIAILVWGTIYALLGCKSFTWSNIKTALIGIFWGDIKYHLTFLCIFIGLYLVTPVLRAFVRGASRRDFHWFFLLVFLFCSLLPTLETLFPGKIALLSVWADMLDIHLVLGYVGFYVAGFYLKNYTLGRLAEFIIYILGILAVVATVWGIHTWTGTSVLTDYHAPHVVLMSVAIFTLFRYVLGVSDERSRRQRLGGVARISFGIYLIHVFFLMLLDHFDITALSFNPIIAVPVLSAVVFLCSFIIAWLISKIPLLGRLLT